MSRIIPMALLAEARPAGRVGTVALLTALLLAPARVVAQDAHYWTSQYGNQARLLGGAVVGSASDLAAVYYNPGLLALVTDPELVLAANVVQWTEIKVNGGLTGGRDLRSTRFVGVPSLFAGELRFGFLGEHRLAYSFVSRSSFNARFKARGDVPPSALDLDLDLDRLAANLEFESQMNDYWIGVTWAAPLGPRFGLGATQFVAVRSHRSRTSRILLARADSASGISLRVDDFEYQHWRLVWKIGAGARLDPWRLGISVTTPSLGLWGSGEVGLEDTVIGNDLDGDGTTTSRVVSNFQDDVPSDWRSPLSIAAGVAYALGRTRLHASAEWFDDVGTFSVLDTEPVETEIDGSTELRSTDVVQSMRSVTNFGVGLQHTFSDKLEGFASFRNDMNAAKGERVTDASISIWNIHHVAGGATFTVGASDFTLGVIYASGSQSTLADLGVIPEGAGAEVDSSLETTFRRLTFIAGFALAFE